MIEQYVTNAEGGMMQHCAFPYNFQHTNMQNICLLFSIILLNQSDLPLDYIVFQHEAFCGLQPMIELSYGINISG